MQNKFEIIYNQIIEWQDKTFENRTLESMLSHLREELDELITQYYNDSASDDMGYEVADCWMLLLCITREVGFSLDDVVKYLEKKLEINKTRKWSFDNQCGHPKHI